MKALTKLTRLIMTITMAVSITHLPAAFAGGGFDAYGGDRGVANDFGGIATAGELGLSGETANGYNTAVSVAVDGIFGRIANSTNMTSDQKAEAAGIAHGQLDAPGGILGAMVEAESEHSATVGGLDMGIIDGLVDGIIDGVLSQFAGRFMGTEIDLKDATLHPNSAKIAKQLKEALRTSGVLSPLTKLGLKGSKILIFENLGFSFYWKESDVIHLAIEDVRAYGMAVLLHELLHAGLEKAKNSRTIPTTLYSRISSLNSSKFSNLNGYVGMSQGYYKVDGYGYQEAFATGYSFHQLNANWSSLNSSSNPYIYNSLRYRTHILENKWLRKLPNGEVLRMIRTGPTTRSDVWKLFASKFTNSTTHVRQLIGNAESAVRSNLPNLCTPGTAKVISQLSCPAGDEIYESPYRKYQQVCGSDLHYQPAAWTSCKVIGYR